MSRRVGGRSKKCERERERENDGEDGSGDGRTLTSIPMRVLLFLLPVFVVTAVVVNGSNTTQERPKGGGLV